MISAFLVGNLGHRPRIRHLPNGKPVLNLHVAVNERDLVDGTWQTTTLWLDVTMFGARAEGLSKILAKGMKVACRGRLRLRAYKGRDGTPKQAVELLADDVEPLEAPRRDDPRERESADERAWRERDEMVDAFKKDDPSWPPAAGQQVDESDSDIPF